MSITMWSSAQAEWPVLRPGGESWKSHTHTLAGGGWKVRRRMPRVTGVQGYLCPSEGQTYASLPSFSRLRHAAEHACGYIWKFQGVVSGLKRTPPPPLCRFLARPARVPGCMWITGKRQKDTAYLARGGEGR